MEQSSLDITLTLLRESTPTLSMVGPTSSVLLLDESSFTVAHCAAGIEGVLRFSPAPNLSNAPRRHPGSSLASDAAKNQILKKLETDR